MGPPGQKIQLPPPDGTMHLLPRNLRRRTTICIHMIMCRKDGGLELMEDHGPSSRNPAGPAGLSHPVTPSVNAVVFEQSRGLVLAVLDLSSTQVRQSTNVSLQVTPMLQESLPEGTSGTHISPWPTKQPCRRFLNGGHCPFGERCRYPHIKRSVCISHDFKILYLILLVYRKCHLLAPVRQDNIRGASRATTQVRLRLKREQRAWKIHCQPLNLCRFLICI